MSSKKLKGYWGNVRDRMAQRLADNHGLAALVVRHCGYNRNAQGLSFRVEGGHLAAHHYGASSGRTARRPYHKQKK